MTKKKDQTVDKILECLTEKFGRSRMEEMEVYQEDFHNSEEMMVDLDQDIGEMEIS